MKTVLLHIHEDKGQEARLQAALDVVRAFEGHLTCLQATPHDGYVVGDPFGGVYAFPEIIAKVREVEDAERQRIEARLASEGINWDWLHYDGSAAQVITDRARLADLIVLSQPPLEAGEGEPLPIAADVALHVQPPVLAVPSTGRGLDCNGIAMVAWNGSAEAANALRQSLPLLKRASAVKIVTVGEEGSNDYPSIGACTYLARHGIDAELSERRQIGDSIAETLAEAALSLGAAYVVMGAYGRSRLREWILGGVTRELLRKSDMPLLLAH